VTFYRISPAPVRGNRFEEGSFATILLFLGGWHLSNGFSAGWDATFTASVVRFLLEDATTFFNRKAKS